MSIVVAALYKFVALPDCRELREALLAQCLANGIAGTLLLAEEGINGTVAGTRTGIDTLLAWLRRDERFHGLEYKESLADDRPFRRMKVKLKREIVTLGVPEANPAALAGTYVAPEQWHALLEDPAVMVIDTRNEYEVSIGSFEGAINPRMKSFREFPAWVARQESLREKPKVAMFCTGGIRCEKSTALLRTMGFENVFHLKGGILKYLETVPEAESRWRGECYVFDERVSVTHGLETGSYRNCEACGMPFQVEAIAGSVIGTTSCDKCIEA